VSLCLVSPRGLQHSPRSRPNPNPHFFGLSHPLCTLPPVLSAAYGLLALLALVASPLLPLCLPPAVSSSCPPQFFTLAGHLPLPAAAMQRSTPLLSHFGRSRRASWGGL
jgi:hypothetical protein